MNKFKINDRVRVIEERGCFELGATGTIMDKDCDMPDVKVDEITEAMDGDDTWCIPEDNLELIPLQMTPRSCKASAMERMATEEDLQKMEEMFKNRDFSSAKEEAAAIFPEDDTERQKYAVGTFICEFFPHAIAELARFSYDMQQKHNPDAPMGWAEDKSIGDGNQIFRHQMDGEYREVAWRGLEQLERLLRKMPPFDK